MRLTASFVALAVLVAAPLLQLRATESPVNAKPAVERGVWSSDFPSAKAFAEANGIPMLVLWANPGCGNCEKLEAACGTPAFRTWQSERQLVMVFGYGASTPSDRACKAFVRNPSGEFPYVGVYWNANTSGEEVLEKFSGLSGKMGHGSDSKSPLEWQLMGAVDDILPDWDPSSRRHDVDPVGGMFLVPGTEDAHLEAILGQTASVAVPLVRTDGVETVATNVLEVAGAQQSVIWQSGESRKDVPVPVAAQTAGEIGLVLRFNGAVVGESFIRVVEAPANSTDNPAWIGDPVEFGEWTMDLDAAKAKVAGASGDACTVVFFTGALWCPWCLGLENHVFAEEEFKNWTKDNQVALVLLDNTKRSPQDSSAEPYAFSVDTDGAAPTLLRYDVGANGRSGAAYLSRKGIARPDAEAVLQRNHDLGYPGGEYCAPETLRTGYPTAIVLDKQGRIRGRFVYQADSSAGKDATGAYNCDFAENMARFRQFVSLAFDESIVEDDKFASTTSLTYEFGTALTTRLSVNRNVNVYRLAGVYGRRVTFSATADTLGSGVSFSVVRLVPSLVACKDASGITLETITVPMSETIATGVGSLTCEFPDDDEVFLMVASFTDARTAFLAAGPMVTDVTFASTGDPLELENKYYGTEFQTVVPLFEDGFAIGTLEVKSTAKNKVSAKYVNAETGKSVTFSGRWPEPDEYGSLALVLTKSTNTLSLSLPASGKLKADLGSVRGTASVEKPDYSRYAGIYTVAVPVVTEKGEKSVESTGVGHLLLKANSSTTKRTGRLSYQFVFPDGKTVTGSGQLIAGENGFANLTLNLKKGSNALVLPLRIRPDAKIAPTHRAVILQKNTRAAWLHDERAISFIRECKAYGSFYDKTESLVDCCGASSLLAGFEIGPVADSEQHGALFAVAGDGVQFDVSAKSIRQAEKTKSFKLTFARTYGKLTGSAKLEFEGGKLLSGTIRAFVLPDWHDCGCFDDDETVPLTADLPFVVGTCVFKDKVNKRTVYRGLSVSLVAEE